MNKTILIAFLLSSFITKAQMSSDIFSPSYSDSLWNITVKPYLAEPLWKTETSYSAGHFLMLPMYAAFEQQNTAWKNDFAQQFKRFADSGANDMGKTLLYRIQYIYLASEYINLCTQYHEEQLIPANLYAIVYNKIESTWMKDKIWNWRHPAYKKTSFKNMRTKVLWKLYNKTIQEPTYQTCILDEEFFTMAIAANLKSYLHHTSQLNNALLDDMTQIAYEAFNKRVLFTADGGWIIQAGYWSNYADFLYAGNSMVTDSIVPRPIPTIAEDFSHSMRYPQWINSFLKASDSNSSMYAYYMKLKVGLTTQLFNKVIVPPSVEINEYQATNYMDGINGVYRYKYNGRQGGIGPYQLSGALQIGWWSFLDSKRIRTIYEHIASNSNLGKMNKYYLYKNINESTFKYLICILAAKRAASLD